MKKPLEKIEDKVLKMEDCETKANILKDIKYKKNHQTIRK